jgi:hypothetical protein
MENMFTKIEELISHIKEYADNRITNVKLSIAEKTSKLIAGLLAAIVVIFVLFFFVVFASIGLAYILSAWIGKMYAGFFIVAGLYLLAGIIIWIGKEKILRLPIMNAMIKKMFDKEDGEI